MKNFKIQWKALKEHKEGNELDVLKVSKALPIIKWTVAFQDYPNRVISAMTIPLSYII